MHTVRAQAAPALAGVLAAGAAIGVSELIAGLAASGPSLAVAVGALIIDLTPQPVETLAVSTFGEHDKLALVITVVAVTLGAGSVVGVASARRPWVATLAFVTFGIVAAVAASRSPLGSLELAVLTAVIAAGTGRLALTLLRPAGNRTPRTATVADSAEFALRRRRFVQFSVGVTGLAVGSAAAGRFLIERGRYLAASRGEVRLPPARDPAGEPPPGATVAVDGMGPVVSPNADFYRVDTAITIPHVDVQRWRLRLTGMVDRPFELTFQELLDMSLEEHYVTLSCVSNEVGGDLVDNAKWLGVPLPRLLERAGVQPGATQVIGRSVDGFTVGFPTAVAMDGRVALVAVGMNGEPLPFDHGFPARLVVAGLYGYVSATKWLGEIELNTLEGFRAYWIPRGWAQQAPIKTQSRIDVPRRHATIAAGRQAVAGVAWAPHRGVQTVEVQVDDAAWAPAELAPAISRNTWVQWVYPWEATPGQHTLRVRATDAAGEVQTGVRRPPPPNGATGYHTVPVTAR